MKYTVRHSKDVDYNELHISSLTITAVFWTPRLWDWNLGFVWKADFKGFMLPSMEVHWYKVN